MRNHMFGSGSVVVLVGAVLVLSAMSVGTVQAAQRLVIEEEFTSQY